MGNALVTALKENQAEVVKLINQAPDWNIAAEHFDKLFRQMIDPKDSLWSKELIDELHRVYYRARDEDKACKNITERTVKAMPKSKANDTKKIFLQIAHTCRVFHASHKVNFETSEIPEDYDEISMSPAKKKGFLTYADEMPTLYSRISLTFDYWVPKILDWTIEIREKGLKEWKGDSILEHESTTDFMRICLLFLSNPQSNPPIAKVQEREAILKFCGENFIWIKKSARREDILGNNKALNYHLERIAAEVGLRIPLESWSRLLKAPFIKSLIK